MKLANMEISLYLAANLFFEKYLKKINKSNVSFILSEIKDKNLTLFIDTLRLKQVLLNLIENAIKFTMEGRVEFGFTIKGDKQITFYVNDTGIGIPYKKQQIIFDRFLQLDYSPAREHGGTGLGLTISKNLVEMMGGTIRLESEGEGRGSRVFFTLPIYKEGHADPDPPGKGCSISSEKPHPAN